MIRRKTYQFKKPLHNPIHAGRCDAVMGRPNDNPYRRGSAEHVAYEAAYEETRAILARDAEHERAIDAEQRRLAQISVPR